MRNQTQKQPQPNGSTVPSITVLQQEMPGHSKDYYCKMRDMAQAIAAYIIHPETPSEVGAWWNQFLRIALASRPGAGAGIALGHEKGKQ